MFADVFEEKESPDKLTSIVEKATVAVGNESSTVPLVLNAIFLEEMSVSWKLAQMLIFLSSIPHDLFVFNLILIYCIQ